MAVINLYGFGIADYPCIHNLAVSDLNVSAEKFFSRRVQRRRQPHPHVQAVLHQVRVPLLPGDLPVRHAALPAPARDGRRDGKVHAADPGPHRRRVHWGEAPNRVHGQELFHQEAGDSGGIKGNRKFLAA